MQPADISRLLVGYGFKDPDLTKIDGTTYTFKFVDYNLKRLTQQFGQPSVAANGKVAVFVVPSYGKLGVSPANRLVRFVYTGNHKKLEIDDSHLSKHKTTDELTLLFHKATANPRYRLTYIEKLWTFYNTHKFKAALPKPKFACSPKPLAKKVSPRARGYYQGGNDFTAGTLWLSQRLFNSTLDIMNEIVLHEMCHQAAWCISKSMDRSDEGHGPVWQGWMRKVGLNPNRYDKLDDTAYSDNLERAITEEALTKDFGPRTPVNFFKRLTKVTSVILDNVIVEYKGRGFRGSFKKQGSKYVFNGVTVSTPAKRIALSYKKFPSTGIYQE